MPKCDCLNECGDDPALGKGEADPCESRSLAISIHDECATVFYGRFMNMNPDIKRKMSMCNLRKMFRECVMPAVDRARALDREGRDK